MGAPSDPVFNRSPSRTKVRFHRGNVTGWTSLPVAFTPSR